MKSPARVLSLVFMVMGGPVQAQETLTNALGMAFVRILAGEFVMGTEDLAAARMEIPEPASQEIADETPAHRVIITHPFYLAQTELTQGVWYQVMGSRPGPEAFWQREDWAQLPLAAASWHMAQRFIETLNRLDHPYRYRLSTEAEWEYAARAGSAGLRPIPEDQLQDHAWFIVNSADRPHPVASREANGFGLYDMLGNVWEWVSDWYAPQTYRTGTRIDPQGPASDRARVRRGGSYHCPEHLVRPAYRSADPPSTRYSVLGFRLILEPR
jgi:formylglycine-generating enzyme required for sulfatase activity